MSASAYIRNKKAAQRAAEVKFRQEVVTMYEAHNGDEKVLCGVRDQAQAEYTEEFKNCQSSQDEALISARRRLEIAMSAADMANRKNNPGRVSLENLLIQAIFNGK